METEPLSMAEETKPGNKYGGVSRKPKKKARAPRTDEPIKKRKKIIHSSQRTMERMRKLGFTCIAKTEKWVPMPFMPGGGKRFDLWGWCDVLALGPDGCWYGVQSCAMSGRAAHVDKLAAPDLASNIAAWMTCPQHRAEIWAWRKLSVKRGGKAVTWEVERTPLLIPNPRPAQPMQRGASPGGDGGLFEDASGPSIAVCHKCGREMCKVSGGTGNVTNDGKLWCGCPAPAGEREK